MGSGSILVKVEVRLEEMSALFGFGKNRSACDIGAWVILKIKRYTKTANHI